MTGILVVFRFPRSRGRCARLLRDPPYGRVGSGTTKDAQLYPRFVKVRVRLRLSHRPVTASFGAGQSTRDTLEARTTTSDPHAGVAVSVPRDAVTFRSLLRAHRLVAGMTQEGLAERSGISPRSIQQLEAGMVRPRRSTVASLADALGLSGSDRQEFEIAAGVRPRRPPGQRPPSDPGPAPRDDVLAVPVLAEGQTVRGHGLLALPRPTPTNVPWPISSLIGRERDAATIRSVIADE